MAKTVTKDLLQMVQKLTKKQLLRCALNLGVEIDENWNIGQLRRTYADQLLAHPRDLLYHLPKKELGIIKIYDGEVAGQMKTIYNTCITFIIVEYGLAEILDRRPDSIDIIVAKDLQEVLNPLIDEVLNDENKQQLSVIEMIVDGLANLLGIVTQQEIAEYIKMEFQVDNEEDLKKGFDIARQYSLLLDSMEWSEQPEPADSENIMFTSLYGWEDKAALWRFIRQRDKEIAHPRKFTEKELMSAMSSTFPVIDSPAKDAFIDYLVKVIGTDIELANYVYFKLWYLKMHCGEGDKNDELLEVHFISFVLTIANHEISDREAEEGMRLLKDFADNLPLWNLHGYTASDYPSEAYVSKLKKPIGSTLRKTLNEARLMADLLNLSGKNGQDSPYLPVEPSTEQEESNPWASQKIGRNDPCPCGSGLKYKKCHGK